MPSLVSNSLYVFMGKLYENTLLKHNFNKKSKYSKEAGQNAFSRMIFGCWQACVG
jgi:hypothetical protein